VEYPEPHRLELETDVIDSICWLPMDHADVTNARASRPDDPKARGATGLGYRPRLIGNLWGYNGQLLTALLPRPAESTDVKIESLQPIDQLGFIIHHGDVTDTVIASPHQRNIDAAGIQGEARMVAVRRNSGEEIAWWCVVEGFALQVEGKTLLKRRGEAETLVDMAI
jgi:hypothetical protein